MLTQAPLIGSLLEGRYRLVELLGRGGMGNVYAAEDVRLGRRYALKILHPELAEDAGYTERFLREAQTIARLQHPNIVDIHSFGHDPSGVVFFTMELLTGEDLNSRIQSRSYDLRQACTWAIQIARAVAAVHDIGLIHRDLKAQNIFLARDRLGGESIKLLDFGIARPQEGSELTRTGVALGTPSYMSPEQIRNENLDCRSDIYSFGVLLYKLITGRLPFSGEPIQVAMQHLSSPVPPPSSVMPDFRIPPDLDKIVIKSMAKKPEERFSSIHEIERELTGLLDILDSEPQKSAPNSSGAPEFVDTNASTHIVRLLPANGEHDRDSSESLDRTAVAEDEIGVAEPAFRDSRTEEIGHEALRPPVTANGQQTSAPKRVLSLLGLVASLGSIAAVLLWLFGIPEPGSTGKGSLETLPVNEPQTVADENDAAIATTGLAEQATGKQPSPVPVPVGDGDSGRMPANEASIFESANPNSLPRDELAKPEIPAVMIPKPRPVKPVKVVNNKDAADGSKGEPRSKPDTEDESLNKKTSAAPLDILIERARNCRRMHNGIKAPPIIITYTVGIDGEVLQASPSSDTPLGNCLAGEVKKTKFAPGSRVGLRIQL